MLQKKWIKLNDLSGSQYSVNKNIRSKTSKIRSGLCDCSNTYVFVKEIIAVAGTIDANEKNKNLINNTFKDNAKDLNIVMPMYKLLEYSNNGL